MKLLKTVLPCIAIGGFTLPLIAADEYDIDKEIVRIRKELSSVAAQRQSVREEAEKDLKDFSRYQERTEKKLQALRNEIDSLKTITETQRKESDSLAALVSSVEASKKQYDLLQDRFRERLIDACDTFMVIAGNLPPMVSKNTNSSVSFLRSELVAKSIDNVEGLQRLIQASKDIEEITAGIQIVQGTSPVPEIKGAAHRLRIGSIFEAVVNSKGTKCGIWDGWDSEGKERWQIIEDPAIAGQILKGINVREGKALPTFVKLPIAQNEAKTEQIEANVEPNEEGAAQ